MFYVNSLYECIVYCLIENTFELCKSTYSCLLNPSILLGCTPSAQVWVTPSWVGIVSAQVSWRSGPQWELESAYSNFRSQSVLKRGRCRSWQHSKLRRTHGDSQGGGALPWSVLFRQCHIVHMIFHTCIVLMIWYITLEVCVFDLQLYYVYFT